MRGIITAIIRKRVHGEVVKNGGYGFILDDSGAERFFHLTNLEDPDKFESLEDGTKVEFDPYEVPGKGPRARRVSVL